MQDSSLFKVQFRQFSLYYYILGNIYGGFSLST
jgi:hypothetical protein